MFFLIIIETLFFIFFRVGPNGEATFCCDSCPQEFPILGEMLSHQKSLHKGQSTRVLDQEQESFNVKLDLENEADPPPVDDEMKPIVCDMEFELMEVDGQEEEIIMDQKVNEVFSVNQINQMTNAQLKKYCSIKDNGNIVCHLCNTSLKAYGQIGRFRRHLRFVPVFTEGRIRFIFNLNLILLIFNLIFLIQKPNSH